MRNLKNNDLDLGGICNDFVSSSLNTSIGKTNLVHCMIDKNNFWKAVNELNNGQIKVYPNPTKEYLYVELENSVISVETLEIADLYGDILISKRVDSKEARYRMNINDLPDGVYIIRIIGERD